MLCVYFSGTGNTRHLSKKLAELLGCDSISVEDKNIKEELTRTSIVILGYPVYFGSSPGIVKEFVEETDWTDKKVLIFVTCGMIPGSADKNIARVLRLKGAKIVGSKSFKMPENVGDIPIFTVLMPAKFNSSVIKRAEKKIKYLAEKIMLGDYYGKELKISTGKKRRAAAPKTKMKIDKLKCIDCGLCRRNCPYGEENFGKKCTMCYRCYANCPQKAVTGLGKRVITQYVFGGKQHKSGT
ncbi:MAG: EFR1 family ferrodoxin [Ruminococcus sp.]|nr:EFR1 family ferrodoxin [Ruminococcus sp.]